MNIYVGNLSYQLTDAELKDAFAAHGNVKSAKIINDRDTGRSKGFGFVEMESAEEGNAAIAQMNGVEVKGREIKVNEARPKQS